MPENEKCLVRLCKDDDMETISLIEEECFSTPWSLKTITDFASLESSSIYTAVIGQEICGYLISGKNIDFSELLRIAVKKDKRRRGIGSVLIGRYLDDCAADMIPRSLLEVRSSNDEAIGLYSSRGYKTIGKRKDYYSSPKEDAVIMELVIDK